MLPIVFGSAVVAIVVGWCASRFGVAAAAAGGVVLGANPTFAELSRSVRGYSLLSLCALGSTLLVGRLLSRPNRATAVVYVATVAAGLATHGYMLLVLLAQIAIVVARSAPLRAWTVRWAAALSLGALAYVEIGARMIRSAGRAGELFRPRFPLALLATLLGGSRTTLVILGILVSPELPPL